MVTNTSIYKIGLYVFLLIVMFNETNNQIIEQRKCALPNNYIGSCVLIDDCSSIRDTLQNAPKPLSSLIVKYLERIYCGRIDNLSAVCCSKPKTFLINRSNIPPAPVDFTKHKNLKLLPSTVCGVFNDNKISGGDKADLFEFPWMALIRYETSNGLKYQCGGSIINNRYILTAAHCIANKRVGRIHSVILGDFNITSERDCEESFGFTLCLPPKEEYFIEELILHPEYNRPRRANDIGLIRLSKSISFAQDHIKPVCLPQTEELQKLNPTNFIVSGWGMTEKLKYSDVLLTARLSITGIHKCEKQYRRFKLSNNQICAKGSGITDSCAGDSGGPLIAPAELNGTKYIQFGIVSAGAKSCGARKENLAVYVLVQNYMTWILDNLKDDNGKHNNFKDQL